MQAMKRGIVTNVFPLLKLVQYHTLIFGIKYLNSSVGNVDNKYYFPFLFFLGFSCEGLIIIK